MYKCKHCRATFESPEEYENESDFVPAPFGNGYVSFGGGTWKGCPECESVDFEEVDFVGYCDNCNGKILEDNDWDYSDELDISCPHCGYKFRVSFGNIEEYSE